MTENGKETLIRLGHNVSKTYQVGQVDVQALWEVNLTVRGGEFVVVLGPSASGKTTLLNLIGGLDSPTAGQRESGRGYPGAGDMRIPAPLAKSKGRRRCPSSHRSSNPS